MRDIGRGVNQREEEMSGRDMQTHTWFFKVPGRDKLSFLRLKCFDERNDRWACESDLELVRKGPIPGGYAAAMEVVEKAEKHYGVFVSYQCKSSDNYYDPKGICLQK